MNAFHHLALNCRDKAASEAFYAKHFGFQRARVFHRDEPNEFVMLRLGHTCLELFSAKETDAQAGPQPVGCAHFAFEVDDLDAVRSGLAADGVEVGEIIDCNALVPGLRICFFPDPDGNRVELMQGWTDEEA